MSPQHSEPIAIVGSGCRFPGSSSSPSALWKLLSNPRDVNKEIPTDRFDVRGHYHKKGAHHGTTNVRRAYLLDEDPRQFDPTFFNISPSEAESIDPQQRLLMETVYEALEAGGHTIDALRGSDTAVYVGNMGVDYYDIIMHDTNCLPTYSATGTSRAIMSNRISFFFDWHGPSMTIDTACSSSLVAVHHAVQALKTGESRVAIASGAALTLSPEMYVTESNMNLLSANGRSRMWDADANGYARGDGIASIVLKKLSDAIADGDHIECLIRGTGINQDGHSTGLTVPSSEAQAALIRQTYANAGLDPQNPLHQPQYFEAHGTGTKVGDPREASAIQQCFGATRATADPLYVGSIKTVIGHTEGAAGLAGLIKGSLAIQHGSIPANMLLNRLNPSVEPFYRGLHVPTTLTKWPALPAGVPRRVSINSFGFGGTNGHAILESYHVTEETDETTSLEFSNFTPFTFSASTENSLVDLLRSYSDHLKTRADISPIDLAWTLQSRRSTFAVKASFAASSIENLITKIDDKIGSAQPGKDIGVRSASSSLRILGVFTGQGAQWPSMGAHLIRSSAYVRHRLAQLEEALDSLPAADRPKWRLTEQILASAETSRITEAELSQPLCTAIQIVLVDLLRTAGITFTAVVGHSSGEIAAAYTAGYFSAVDAIRIAYYRGMYARLAGDPSGEKGAMMAVGMSWDEAHALVNLPAFKGGIQIAAQNSAASITLSGNKDKLTQAKELCDQNKKFARFLKVDTAYHSHHMIPCGDPYVKSLRECGIRINKDRPTTCTWHSSVTPGKLDEDALADLYWRDNMTNAVLFTDAVHNAAKHHELNLALEVGPHPALKGPASQNLSDVGVTIPYSGVLARNANDIDTFSDALGFVWSNLGSGAVDFKSYHELLSDSAPTKLVTNLPQYQWNRSKIHYHESRRSRKFRTRSEGFHELLGALSPNSTERELRWSNFLKASEISWLTGHQLQGQTVFPAAGYAAMCLEAAKHLADQREVMLYEILDLSIGKAIAFEDDASFAAETLVTLTSISPLTSDSPTQTAVFSCYSCPSTGSGDLELVASANMRIQYGTPAVDTLSSVPVDGSTMNEVDSERFYQSALQLGYGYTGPFKGLSNLRRKLDQATGLVETYRYSDDEDTLVVHPTWLDVAFQAVLLAFSAPGDDRAWSLQVPTSIGSIRVNPELCAALPISGTKVPISAALQSVGSSSMVGSVDMFTEDCEQTLLQVEDLKMKPFSPATSEDDRRLYTYNKWEHVLPNGPSVSKNDRISPAEADLALVCERVAFYYLRKWQSELSDEEWENGQWWHQHLHEYLEHTMSEISGGRRAFIKPEWADDSEADIKALISNYGNSTDIIALQTVGENLPASVRGETNMLELMMQDNIIDKIYKEGLGMQRSISHLVKMVQQVLHRYPAAKILEIGSNANGTTGPLLEAIGKDVESFTFTNASDGAFEKATDVFHAYARKMNFKVLDIESAPSTQGFEAQSYDLVLATNVFHATASLQETLTNARELLKPGGTLLFLEITNNESLKFATLMGGLPGWWAGVNDGRTFAPTISSGEWHSLLRKSGFSGVDSTTRAVDAVGQPFSVMASQAVDDRINFLRRPLMPSQVSMRVDEIVILGSKTLATSQLASELEELLSPFCHNVLLMSDLPTEDDELVPMNTFINLVDLDFPVFKDMSGERMQALQRMFERAKNLLWVTRGAQVDDPYHSASQGFTRTVRNEMPELTMTALDFTTIGPNTSRIIAETVLRQCALSDWGVVGLKHPNMLWSQETEILHENEQLLIPRYVHQQDMNDRLNSSRRNIEKKVSPSASKINISHPATSAPFLEHEVIPSHIEIHKDAVDVHASILTAMNIGSGAYLFLSKGQRKATGESVIALSTSNASTIIPLAYQNLGDINCTPTLLAAIAGEISAAAFIDTVPQGSHILVHEAKDNPFLASAIARLAKADGISLTFSTTSPTTTPPVLNEFAWIKLTAWTPKHVVRRTFPTGLTHFVNLNVTDRLNDSRVGLTDGLPVTCKRIESADLFHGSATPPPGTGSDIKRALWRALAEAQANSNEGLQAPIVSLKQIGEATEVPAPTTIVEWTSEETVTVRVRPLEVERLFARNKSYLLVGLTGSIGQSVCQWMAENGAGCICLTSRNPNVDQKWVNSIEALGATVKVFSMDVSNRHSVQAAVANMRATCPPIAGVANGAMVLRDGLFAAMTHDAMTAVLSPKIAGTNNLAEAFKDDDLDFFMMLSSVAAAVGNMGQSSYSAACAYMAGLARQRHNRGLNASSFDIGRVVGLGYLERATDLVRDQLVRFGLMAISELDFRAGFAESIHIGNPSNEMYPVITTGIRLVDITPKVPWLDDPRLSHCFAKEYGSESKSDGDENALSVLEQLESASSKVEALNIIMAAFSHKLQTLLARTDQTLDPSTPVIELGIDSLVAVEVRSWFVKSLKVDMPVLKVLGGGSIADLSEQALQKLPENFNFDGAAEPAKAAPAAPAAPAVTDAPAAPLTTSALKAVEDSTATSDASTNGVPTPDQSSEDLSTGDDSSVPSVAATTPEQEKPDPMEKAKKPTANFVRTELASFAQSRFWFLRYLIQDSTTFNVTFYYKLNGYVRIGDLEKAVRKIGLRHEVLRTCFVGDEQQADVAYQKIMEYPVLRLEHEKINSFEDAQAKYKSLGTHDFDLENGDGMRIVLLSRSPSSHYLLFAYHHIIMDGIGHQVLLADLQKAYQGASLGSEPKQLSEFSRDQRESYESGRMKPAIDYWKSVFPDQPPVLPLLPMSNVSARKPMGEFNVHQVQAMIPHSLIAGVKNTSKANRSTPFHLYLAAFKTMLFCFTEAPELTIGIAEANRTDGGVENTIGLFLNLLTLRFRRQSSQKFSDALTEARTVMYAALEHASVPFDVLLRELKVSRSSSHSPFFQAFFDYRQGAQGKVRLGNCELEIQEIHPGRTAYDITLDVTDSDEGTLIMLRTQKGLYDVVAAQLLLDTYVGMLEHLTADASVTLEDTPLYTQKQLEQAVSIGRGTDLESDWPETLPHRVDEIAKQNGENVAIMDGRGKVLTYNDMIKRVEAIGEALQNANVKDGSRVLVYQQATSDWSCSMLAIMRVGGVYVPLDLRNPLPRLAAVADDCQPRAILADVDTLKDAERLKVPGAKIINVSQIKEATKSIPVRASADGTAAILYTSGSTGTPKGIVIKHSGLRNEIEGYTKTWGLGAERVLQQSAFTFNHASDQMWTGFVNGGMISVVPWDKRGDPLEITKIMEQHQITYTKATPSEYMLWLQFGRENLKQCSTWRCAFGGGESLTKLVPNSFKDLDLPQLRFFNSYGPAEVSISSTKMEIFYREPIADGRIPCGYMLPNYVAYILDENLKPVPAGMPGEIVIGGAGVSLGYLQNTEMTCRHFVEDPYATPRYAANGWTRMYRTGDIGHLESDGALVFHSRMAGDTQVKIRGLRIELSDIESNIVASSQGKLQEAVVTRHEGEDHSEFLVSHVVFAQNHGVENKETYLAKLLTQLPIPQYMIPVVAVPLDRLPLSNHSKVDRKAIQAMPLPQRSRNAENVELSETMHQLKYVWQDVLGHEELSFGIGPTTSFFTVGGNSLLIVRLQSRIRDFFNVVIRLIDLLQDSTLGGMARKIEESAMIEAIDWEKETELPEVQALENATPIRSEKRNVLLTGATGFLGGRILAQLVADPTVSKIHCVAVREKPGETGSRKLSTSSPKIVVHPGDISAPQLGLPESTFSELSESVDVVVHMAAARSFWDNYHVLRPTNVVPAREIVRLAAPRHVPVHYFSSYGVLPADADVRSPSSVASNAPATDGKNGYVASRWAAEQILERAQGQFALPVTVHRFVPATQPDDATLSRLLADFSRFVDVAGVMPEFEAAWSGSMDLVPVQTAEKDVTAAVLRKAPADANITTFLHHECPAHVDAKILRAHVEAEKGHKDYPREGALKWVGRIKRLGFPWFLATQEIVMRQAGSKEGSEEGLVSKR